MTGGTLLITWHADLACQAVMVAGSAMLTEPDCCLQVAKLGLMPLQNKWAPAQHQVDPSS